MEIEHTDCCALDQLFADNITSLEHLRNTITVAKIDAKKYGATALYCIVTPAEPTLEKNLKSLKFKKIASFYRRKSKAKLKMYFLDLKLLQND